MNYWLAINSNHIWYMYLRFSPPFLPHQLLLFQEGLRLHAHLGLCVHRQFLQMFSGQSGYIAVKYLCIYEHIIYCYTYIYTYSYDLNKTQIQNHRNSLSFLRYYSYMALRCIALRFNWCVHFHLQYMYVPWHCVHVRIYICIPNL